MKPLKAAAVQFQHVAGEKSYNIERIHSFTKSASEQSVDLLVFPEMCITGYWHVRHLSREKIKMIAEPIPDGPSVQKLLSFSSSKLYLT